MQAWRPKTPAARGGFRARPATGAGLRVVIRSGLIWVALAALAGPGLADGNEEPWPTETTRTCGKGYVWNAERAACVAIQESRATDAERLEQARELATFGRAADALAVLSNLAQPETADALTLRGYATRKAGDVAAGLALYDRALALDPDHWQARAYLGAAMLEAGDRAGAAAQLAAIRRSGGRGSYPETALTRALSMGGSLY